MTSTHPVSNMNEILEFTQIKLYDEEENSSSEDEWLICYDDFGYRTTDSVVRSQNKFIKDRKIGQIKDNPPSLYEKCQMCTYCDIFHSYSCVRNADGGDRNYDKLPTKCKKCPGCEYMGIDNYFRYSGLVELYNRKMSSRIKNDDPTAYKLCYGCAMYEDENYKPKIVSKSLYMSDSPLKKEDQNSFFAEDLFENDDKAYDIVDGPHTDEFLSRKQKQFLLDRNCGRITDNPATSSEKCQMCTFCDVYDANNISISYRNSVSSKQQDSCKIVTKTKKCPGCKFYKIEEQNHKVQAYHNNLFKCSLHVKKQSGFPYSKICYGCCLFGDRSAEGEKKFKQLNLYKATINFITKKEQEIEAGSTFKIYNKENSGLVVDKLTDEEQNSSSEDEWALPEDEYGNTSFKDRNLVIRYQNEFIEARKIGRIKDNPPSSYEKCQMCTYCDILHVDKSLKNADGDDQKYDKILTQHKKCPGCKFINIDNYADHPRTLELYNAKMSFINKNDDPTAYKLCFGCAMYDGNEDYKTEVVLKNFMRE